MSQKPFTCWYFSTCPRELRLSISHLEGFATLFWKQCKTAVEKEIIFTYYQTINYTITHTLEIKMNISILFAAPHLMKKTSLSQLRKTECLEFSSSYVHTYLHLGWFPICRVWREKPTLDIHKTVNYKYLWLYNIKVHMNHFLNHHIYSL